MKSRPHSLAAAMRVLPLLLLGSLLVHSAYAAQPAIEVHGLFIDQCTLPGETRKDDVVLRAATEIQVAANRWLVLYNTHGYRGVDDKRSIVYQLRKDRPDGPVVKEGYLMRTENDWRPLGVTPPAEGTSYVKQHGHMVAFGVPRDALIDGKVPAHANHFVALWRVAGRTLVKAENRLEKAGETQPLFESMRGVEWCQFRLNAAGDDLEFTQPAHPLRQKGFETGPAYCERADAGTMTQSYVQPVAANAAKTEWAVAEHFEGRKVAAIKFAFDEKTGLYDWVKTGPFIGDLKLPYWEASLIHTRDEWVMAARGNGKVNWVRSADPFQGWGTPAKPDAPSVSAPLTAFLCGDGIIRLFCVDKATSPQNYDRDPLCCWDVKTQPEFEAINRRVIFDSLEAKLPIRPASRSKIDFCELGPLHGQTQLLLFSVSARAYNFIYDGVGIPPINQQEKDVAGVYYATMTYAEPVPAAWVFR